MSRDISTGPILLCVSVALIMGAVCNITNMARTHAAYNAADLTRDTGLCKMAGLKIKPRTAYNARTKETQIVGADCVDSDGSLLSVQGVSE